MPIGPGRYDDACTTARESTGAEGVLLIVVNGKHGHGFSAQLTGELLLRANVPAMLRDVATQIERSLESK
jgi:hypothetical protein